MTRIVKINGMDVDLDRIQNPKLRRVVRDRITISGFLFNHSEDSGPHQEHTDRTDYGDYSERSSHSDESGGRRHSRHTDHTETARTEEEYHAFHEDYDARGYSDNPSGGH